VRRRALRERQAKIFVVSRWLDTIIIVRAFGVYTTPGGLESTARANAIEFTYLDREGSRRSGDTRVRGDGEGHLTREARYAALARGHRAFECWFLRAGDEIEDANTRARRVLITLAAAQSSRAF